MAEPNLNLEEQTLRRRARRRLVGALAIALLAILILPMVFDPEPKPLDEDVEILIPGQETPFTPAPPLESGTQPAPVDDESVPPDTPVEQAAAEVPVEPKAVAKAPLARKPATAPVTKSPQGQTPAEKPAPTPEKKTASSQGKANPEKAKAPTTVAKDAYTLQLGAFSTEANAAQFVDRIRKAGMTASIVKEQGQYKVRHGAYDSRDEATAAQAALESKGLSPIVVGP